MKFHDSLAFAKSLDKKDPLNFFRKDFLIPKVNGRTSIYFTGNSLGLQPKAAKKFIDQELNDWAKFGVEGHFLAERPWVDYHKFSQRALANITGAKVKEVVAMNGLTVNLHLLLTSFYRPSKKRFKIITEAGSFSSDRYALESHIALHGLREAVTLIEISPRTGEHVLRTEDILSTIKAHGEQVSLVLLGAVQYYSGQFFDIKRITKAGHAIGALVGFDLAHAIGNVPLALHADKVDFAVWCSYKYLNGGPGGVAGAFVHEKRAREQNVLRLAGWWGHNQSGRFQMKKGFIPMKGAEGWQVSNFPVLLGAPQLASLEIVEKAGMQNLRTKSMLMSSFLYFLLENLKSDSFVIITPENPAQRGCQLSLLMTRNGKKIFKALAKEGVIADWREPDVIRVAPVPLYNTFEEIFRFVQIIKSAL